MSEWWAALSGLQQLFYCIAIPSTLLLVLQTILVIVGFGDGGSDFNPSDTSGLDLDIPEGDFSTDSVGELLDGDASRVSGEFGTLRLFTVQGVVAFLATFSWVAIVAIPYLPDIAAVLIGLVCGFIMMYVVAKILQLSTKLTENGTFRLQSILGETAQVYITVLPKGEMGGKVTVNITSRFAELDAVTDGAEPIPSGSRVRIVDVRGNLVVVEKD